MNFEPQIHTECEELAQKLLELIPELFSKTRDWTKTQQGKQRPEESVPDYYGSLKQNSGLTPKSLSNHQNDPCLTLPF